MALSETTLIILKHPFRAKAGTFRSSEIHLLRGSVKSNAKRSADAPEVVDSSRSNFTVEIPRVDAIPSLSAQSGAGLFPASGTILYVRPAERVPLTLAWPQAKSGYVALLEKKSNRMSYLPIANQRSIALVLAQNSAYFWQLIGTDKKPVLGPYSFELRMLNDEVARDLLKHPQAGVQVYW